MGFLKLQTVKCSTHQHIVYVVSKIHGTPSYPVHRKANWDCT